jgi:hypothetical protein
MFLRVISGIQTIQFDGGVSCLPLVNQQSGFPLAHFVTPGHDRVVMLLPPEQ